MPNSLVFLISALILLTPLVREVQEHEAKTVIEVHQDKKTTQLAPATPASQERGLKQENDRVPQSRSAPVESAQEVLDSDWPAPIAASVTGLPSLLSAGSKNQTCESHTNQVTPQGPRTKLASQPKVAVARTKERSWPPFSEVIVKLTPVNVKQLTPEMDVRRQNIERCLKNHFVKPVNADVLRPWSIMHGVLAYGQDSLVVSRGKRMNAVDYLCQNGIGNDRRLLMSDNGKLTAAVGAGFQGHEGQLLAILAQVQAPLDQPLVVNGNSFTVRDLVAHEMATCRPGTELTFKLIGLSVYLKSDAVWKDNTGQAWDISRLMYEEMAQPIKGAACGGIHRLMGLSYALAMRKAGNEPIDGQWQRAEKFISNYHQQSLALQTSDGGFSTEFFEGMSTSQDPIRQVYSTGHLLEWLAISMTNEQLASQPVTRMVDRLLVLLAAEFRPEEELNGTDVGPKGHALRALRLYQLRMFGQPSNYTEFQDKDPRPIVAADQVATAQQNQRTILPSSTQGGDYIQSSHAGSKPGKSSTTLPNSRSNRLMRRR